METARVQSVLVHSGGNPSSTASVSVNCQSLLMYLLLQLFLFSEVFKRLSAAFPGALCWRGDTGRTAQQINDPLLSL